MTKPVTLRISESIYESLQIASEKRNISISAIIRDCINQIFQAPINAKQIGAYRPRYKYSRKIKEKETHVPA